MRFHVAAWAVLVVLALAGARADDVRRPPAPDPDAGFLEFLGSVDRLSEVNPNYLAQSARPRAVPVAAKPRPPPPPPPPPSPGAQSNE